jgi:LmbE family N-acetylglucosaminyl deacetylase
VVKTAGIFLALAATLTSMTIPHSARAEEVPPAEILQQLRAFNEMGSVLYVAAHPDDENTQLIAYFARGRNYRTAYLSLTRGDGGQNVLGPEFGSELGVIRTQELLAARRLDGGQQFFTRAMDFGFSKDYRETLRIWDKDEVVADIVRVIRTFRPDVMITRFSTVPGGTHGHHTASAVLALEAFKLAGDTNAFPDQLTYLKPWQPKRIFVNSRGGENALQIEANGTDPVSGETFAAIAGRSRSMHKSQGFGNFGGGGGGSRVESFQLLAGEPATNDIMDGVDTTWNRIPGGAEIGEQASEIIAQFDLKNPAASVDALLALKKNLSALPAEPLVEEKRRQLDRILQACLGLSVVATVPHAEVVPGEKLMIHVTATVHAKIPVVWLNPSGHAPRMRPDEPSSLDLDFTHELAGLPLTQPYWLREEPTTGMFRVADAKLIGQPVDPPVLPLTEFFQVRTNSEPIAIETVPVEAGTEAGKFEARRTLEVIPPVSLDFTSDVKLFTPGSTSAVEIEITAARAHSTGTLKLNAPAGWKILPASQSFNLATVGEKKKFTFSVTAPEKPTDAGITASAQIGDATFGTRRIEIAYKHIPHILLQPPARLKAVCLNLAIRGKKIGYVPGAGDSVAEALTQMGYDVTSLTGADLTASRLKDFDAVVIGVRAFNVRTDLVPQLPALFAYVADGGNVIEQYNRPGGDLKTDQLAPYRLHLSGERVTDETATMTFLAPDHPVLNTPNKITSADFDGWVQERGIYFPNEWDEHFTPILACHDPGEAPLKGSLLVAQYGKGYFVYTGLVFFRELPAGVPGAYRLFANLVSLGK